MAARDGVYPAFSFAPAEPDLDRAIAAYGALTRVNRAHWDAGRLLLGWAHAAGFTEVSASASVWCFATDEERAWWGDLWADRFTDSAMADRLAAFRPDARVVHLDGVGHYPMVEAPDRFLAAVADTG